VKSAAVKSGPARSGAAKSGAVKAATGRVARPVKSTGPAVGPFPIPAVGPPRPVRVPAVADYTLDNGLRVLVARRSGIPRFECRLVVPTARGDAGDAARLRVLTETVLSGTPGRSSRAIAEELQGMGAGLGTHADAEQLIIGGSSLSGHRAKFLELFGDVVRNASFPAGEVAIERERVVQEIALLRSQPGVVAHDSLMARLYGRHPYGRGTPDPEAVSHVQPAVLRRLHAERVRPAGSLLVLAGDLDHDRTLADVEEAFGGWESGAAHGELAPPTVSTPAPILLVDRPGAVQTNIRIGGAAIPRTDPQYPALALAVTVFGGYFTSRLNDNIREQKGYTYGAHSRVEHRRVAAQLSISADVGREVTGPSLVEIAYELGRMVSLPVGQSELDAARRYLQGTLAMGIQTQAGLTSYLTTLISAGLPVHYLRDYPAALDRVTVDAVLDAARAHLAPSHMTTVLVGDAASVAPAVAPLGPVELSA
jgi:predicted Zn-dependent peptidase